MQQHKRLCRWVCLCAAALLCACASPSLPDIQTRLQALLPADALLLGEQHDAPEHQQLHRAVVLALVERGALASLAIEMAEQGHSTANLDRNATAAQVRAALHWRDEQWPWDAYGPAIMAAVGAGVPVMGANLPGPQMATAMRNTGLDDLLPAPARTALQDLVRQGHCNTLAESKIAPMTRIQIARDVAMATTITLALQPGKTVVLLAGSVHANRNLGVAQHLDAKLRVRTLLFQSEGQPDALSDVAAFDQVWPTRLVAPKDHCAELLGP